VQIIESRGVVIWLVTGACGYIGANLVKSLRSQGIPLIALDNLSSGLIGRISEDDIFIEGDIRDQDLLRSIFSEYQISTVINLAGLKSPEESFERRYEYFEVNADAVQNLLKLSKQFGVSVFVQSSSSSVYGNSIKPKLDEASKTIPISPYGESKRKAEEHVEEVLKGSLTRGISLRYFNVVGALDRCLKDTSSFNLFPKTITSIRSGEPPVIYGTNYPTRDGTCVRDYIHVGDLIEAHILVAQNMRGRRFPPVLNLGLGRGHTVKEVIECIMLEMNSNLQVLELDPRKGDPAMVIADTTMFKSLFTWHPKRSLDDMVKSSI
jgi:UDP-glucose 4-epimerase